jgi:hypothetical protein
MLSIPEIYGFCKSYSTHMKSLKYLFPFLLFSCALIGKYHGIESVYLKFLTEVDKNEIQQDGAIFKSVVVYNASKFEDEVHDLRVTFDPQKNKYVFVRIGSFVEQGVVPNEGGFGGGLYFIDSMSVDNFGNVTYRAAYQESKPNTECFLLERWTSEMVDNRFLRHFTSYSSSQVKTVEGTYWIKDSQEIKFYQHKFNVKFGKWVYYDKEGKVEKMEVYDDDGKLVSDE